MDCGQGKRGWRFGNYGGGGGYSVNNGCFNCRVPGHLAREFSDNLK